MTWRNVLKRIFLVGGPLLISSMSQYLMTLADTAMVGRLGALALAGISIGGSSTWMLFVFAWPVSIGVQAVAGRRVGRNEAIEAGETPDDGPRERIPLKPVVGAGLLYTLIASLLALFLSTLAEPLYSLVLKNPDVASGALSYLRYTRWAVIFVGLGMVVQGFLNSMRRTRGVMAVTVSCNAVNVLLNWIFIFGRFGFPAMGIAGAGLATLCSQVLQAAILWILMITHQSTASLKGESMRPDGMLIHRVASLSLPVAIQNGAAIFIMLFYATRVENVGTVYLAVNQVIFSFYRINKTLVGGFARGAGILASNALGAGDEAEARRITRVQQGLGLFIGLLVMTLVLSIPGALIRIFTDDEQVIATGIRVMRFFAGFFLVEISAFSLEIIFQALGWSRYVLFSEFTTNVIFILGATLILMNFTGMGIWGAWTGFALYQLGHAAILTAGWISGRWLKVKVEH